MIKVLYTINNLDTAGMKYVLADIVKNIDRDSFIPIIGVNRISESAIEKELKQYCKIFELNLKRKGRSKLKYFISLFQNRKILKNHFDLVHSFDYSSDWSEGVTVRFAGIPWLTEKTNLNYDDKKWKYRLKLAARIVCLSRAQVTQLRKYKRKVVRIPTGIDVNKFSSTKPFDRQKFGLNDDDIVLVSVAHLVPVKGHKELLIAFSQVINKCIGLKLVLAGTSIEKYSNELKELVRDLRIENSVIFLGYCSQIPELLKMSDGKILATRNEGRREAFGAAIIEAMAAGLPVIATKSGGPEDIIENGVDGWLIEPDSVDALSEALINFYNNPRLRKEMGLKGKSKSRKEYDHKLMVRRYENLYRDLF